MSKTVLPQNQHTFCDVFGRTALDIALQHKDEVANLLKLHAFKKQSMTLEAEKSKLATQRLNADAENTMIYTSDSDIEWDSDVEYQEEEAKSVDMNELPWFEFGSSPNFLPLDHWNSVPLGSPGLFRQASHIVLDETQLAMERVRQTWCLAELVHVPIHEAARLLGYFRWDTDRLVAEYFNNPEVNNQSINYRLD